MNKDIQRLIVDFYNNTPTDVIAQMQYNTSEPIVDVANAYTLVIESAEINLGNMPLDLEPNFTILIMCNLKDAETPAGMIYGPNYYTFPGVLRTVQELMDWFYGIFHKEALPYNLGSLGIDSDGYFTRMITQAVYDASYSVDQFEVYFNTALWNLLPEFSLAQPIEAQDQLFYRFQPFVGTTKQEQHTLSRLLKARSIRFSSTLPTPKYRVNSTELSTIVKAPILTSIAINSESYDVLNKHNMVYIPNVFRHITLQNSSPIETFTLWVMIYYAGGKQVMHSLKPGDYFNLHLAFIPIGREI